MEPGKDRKDPNDPENYGTADHNKGRNDAFADTPGSSSGIVHKCRQAVRKPHDGQTDGAIIEDLGIRVEHRQEGCPKDDK